MKRKKLHRKRVERTPAQIAMTCKSSREAHSKGKEVHRAYLIQQLEKLPHSKKVELFNSIQAMQTKRKSEENNEEKKSEENKDEQKIIEETEKTSRDDQGSSTGESKNQNVK